MFLAISPATNITAIHSAIHAVDGNLGCNTTDITIGYITDNSVYTSTLDSFLHYR